MLPHTSTMERQCVELLPQVCKLLAASGKALPDDTSLEKLMDWFSGATSAGQSLLETCPCLLGFISTVIHNEASDPSVLSFAFKLTGLLASTPSGFDLLQEESLLDLVFDPQRWQGVGPWDDPCVRIGWIQGLRSLLQHPDALQFLVRRDLTKSLLQLQTDTSLFIASAANEALAHILVFRPLSSGECTVAEGEKGGAPACVNVPADIDADSRDLAPTLGTGDGFASVAAAIFEHLKASLVPKENAHLHQSLQSLRLLALLFAQAGPRLLGVLLRTVMAALKALVTAGQSAQTPLLLDVLLTARSRSDPHNPAPDQTASCLISQVLDTYKPPEVTHAAAAILRRSHCDLNHATKAAQTLLLPLDIITGLDLLGPQSAAIEKQRASMVELMCSKTPCVSVLAVCLTHTPQITPMPPEIALCPPMVFVTAVLSLLRICGGQTVPSSTGSSKACRNIIGCGKLQKCGLEALLALSASPAAEEKMTDVFPVLIQYLHNPDSDPTVLQKSYQALVKWISVCSDLSSMGDQLGQEIVTVVRKRVCDVRWEVRDSTVEFLGELAGLCICKESARPTRTLEAFLGCGPTPLLTEALRDPESYVRASAVTALAQTLTQSWQQGAAPTEEQTEVVERLLEILSEDTEGFARRAVVKFFIAWYSTCSSSSSSSLPSSLFLMKSVCLVLSRGSADLDWEVKVHTLELAEQLLDKALDKCSGSRPVPHPYAAATQPACRPRADGAGHRERAEADRADVLRLLVEQGVVSAMLGGVFDCDRPVALKACRLLLTLRETICPPVTVEAVSCELPGRGWGREVRTLLRERKGDWTKEGTLDAKEGEMVREESSVLREDGVVVGDVLRCLNLDDRLSVLLRSSDHVHNSPLSLLQDIVSARRVHTDPDTQLTQEVVVDCY